MSLLPPAARGLRPLLSRIVHRPTDARGLRRLGARGRRADLIEKLEWVSCDVVSALKLPELSAFFREDDREGGYLRGFPGGSIWEIEGLFLYALARALAPEIVIETGTYAGCSTRHLSIAISRNSHGRVYSIDIDPRMSDALPGNDAVVPICSDSVSWLEDNPELIERCGLFFHDSDHSPEHVRREVRAVWDRLPRGAVVVSHDVHSPAHNPIGRDGTWTAFRSAVTEPVFRLDFHPLSDCGLGIARKV